MNVQKMKMMIIKIVYLVKEDMNLIHQQIVVLNALKININIFIVLIILVLIQMKIIAKRR